ncbi:ATPase, T2SS/T4P/T4SS family, partial [Stenotrophomonas maltophilia]|uniref:ATPase, T2SS/T4P/T4SS family n=1 Tax=Stenotrophomonas maltophilia TaxID=40324 RepID=UPI003CCFEF2F
MKQPEFQPQKQCLKKSHRKAQREDPDNNQVGEHPDQETNRQAHNPAETRHHVLGTLPNSSAANTNERIN